MATFIIKDIFEIPGVGLIVVGNISNGLISVGMEGKIKGKKITVKKIEKENSSVESISQGEECALTIKGIKREEISKGETIYF
ncbi:hypothetical protein J7K24_00500 [bacterium]|nr:hypothetical protein [bacterium]